MQQNNNSMNNNQMHDRFHHNTAQLQAQLQQHLNGGFMQNHMHGMGGCGNNMELPEPPVSFEREKSAECFHELANWSPGFGL